VMRCVLGNRSCRSWAFGLAGGGWGLCRGVLCGLGGGFGSEFLAAGFRMAAVRGESKGCVAWVGFLVNGERFRLGSARLVFVVNPTDPLGVDERVATCFDGGNLHVPENRPGAEELDVHLIIQ
jgi:hypothetical protein